MAFITISTNQPISPEQQAEIVQAFGKAVACVPNQSAQSILINFEQKPMWYQDNRPVAIAQISNGKITPNQPTLNESILQNFLAKRPLISLTEIRYAFNLTDKQAVLDWLGKVQNEWRSVNGEFVEKCGTEKPTKFVHT